MGLLVDTHCHTSQYWYEPVETLLDVMSRNNVDKASLIQLGGLYDNAYLVETPTAIPLSTGTNRWKPYLT